MSQTKKASKSKPRGKNANLAPLKAEVLALIGQGETVQNSMMAVNRSLKTWESWKRSDPQFRAAVERVRHGRGEALAKRSEEEFPSFADFSKEYLDAPVWPHMPNVIDVLGGKDPT